MLLFGELIVWAVLCTVFISYERGVMAFWATVVACGVLWLTGINVAMLAWANPLLVAQGLVAYMIVGFCWATFKFVVKLRKARNKYIVAKANYLGYDETRTEQGWIENVKNTYGGKEQYAPTVSRNKGTIMFWAWWWPFSVISFFIEDLIRELWNMSWKVIRSFFEKIRSKILGEAAKDLD